MGLEPKIVNFRARRLPWPGLPFLATQRVHEVTEIDRDRIEIEWMLKGAKSD